MNTSPAPVRQPVDVEQLWHINCCDPDTALCGEDLTDGLDGTPDASDECVVCVDLNRLPTCSARFCRLRSWWRGWRSR